MGRHSSDDSDNSHSRRRRRSRSRSSSCERSYRKSPSRSHKRSRRSKSRSTERSQRNRKHKSYRRSRSSSISYKRSKPSGGTKSSKSRRRSQSRSRRHSHSSDSDDSSGHSSQKPASLRSNQQSSSSLDYLSNAKKAEVKVQMALKAAAAADEVLKGSQGTSVSRPDWRLNSTEDQQKRANAIEQIDSEGFIQESFKSTRSEIPLPKGSAADASHAGAMFGTSSFAAGLDIKPKTILTKVTAAMEKETMMHPNLFISAEEKMDRWKEKLMELRRKKLQETGGIIP